MKLVFRHGLSEANNYHNIGKPAFGHADADLMAQGREQALLAGREFVDSYGGNRLIDTVAVSMMARTQQTAQVMGFTTLESYALLDEVDVCEDKRELREMLDNGHLPMAALEKAQDIIDNPPREDIWVTHGLVIAGLCRVLNVHQQKRLIPYFCELRELPLENY